MTPKEEFEASIERRTDDGSVENVSTGRLEYIGMHNLGGFASYRYWRCVDCGCDFPELYRDFRRDISCNGHFIILCPWCRLATEQWKN